MPGVGMAGPHLAAQRGAEDNLASTWPCGGKGASPGSIDGGGKRAWRSSNLVSLGKGVWLGSDPQHGTGGLGIWQQGLVAMLITTAPLLSDFLT